MKTALLALAIILSPSVILAQRLDKLKWLEGKWNRKDVSGTAQAFEEWHVDNSELKGLGVMLDDGDTVFVERLTIKKRLTNLFYITEVAHNKEPTNFKITSISNDSFICENETDDFPKRIAYYLDNKTLTVTISGNSRSRNFVFIKED